MVNTRSEEVGCEATRNVVADNVRSLSATAVFTKFSLDAPPPFGTIHLTDFAETQRLFLRIRSVSCDTASRC
jgi:hypothetical protein